MDAQKEKNSELEQIRHLAFVGRELNEAIINFLSELPPVQSEVHPVSLQLLRTSFDMGRGLYTLLEMSPADLAAPALALHRSQIETFLRGVYLGFLASDGQIKDFIEKDEGIRKPTKNGKWDKISIKDLSVEVEQLINQIPADGSKHDGKLSRMTENAWKPLSGFVHGGTTIHSVYTNHFGQIGCDLSAASIARFVGNCFVIGNFTFAVIITKIHKSPDMQLGDDLNQKFKKFFDLHNQIKNNLK